MNDGFLTMKLATYTEFAELQGVDISMVTKWRKAGRLVLVEVEDRKLPKINVEASQRLIKNTTDLARAENGKNSGGSSLAVGQTLTDDELSQKMKVARVHREEQEAMLAELNLKEKAGEFVLAPLVDQTIVSVAVDIRMGLERIPARVAGKLCEITNRSEIEKFLNESIDEVLADLSENIRNKRREFISLQTEEADA